MSLFFQQTRPPGKLLLSDPPNKYRQILPDIMGGYESLRAPPGGGAKEDFSTAGKAGWHYAPLKPSYIIVCVLDYHFGFPSTARHNSKQHISGFLSKAYSWAFDLQWVNGWLGNNCKLVFDK
jgi:hypothetical protein